ncbi:MAG: magnesium transporter, partial [Clostridioides sp.]|nr:magnesium transporter [Clostridioides sp.]
MDRKQDISDELLLQVKELINNKKLLELRELMEEYHIMDILDIIEEVEDDEKIKIFEVLPLDMAASVLEEMDSEFFKMIIEEIDVEHTKNILKMMSHDDMVDIINLLEPEEQEKVLELLSEEDADDVKELLGYEEDSSGGTMTTGYIYVNEDMTAVEAINHIRNEAKEAETIYYIYVVDNKEKLVGVLSLKELIVARDNCIIKDLMSENIVSVYVDEDREEAVRLVSKYNLVCIPVIDREGVLKGIITIDDIIDVIEEEATEDMYKIAGSSEYERSGSEQEKTSFFEQLISSVRGRIIWLLMSAIGGIIASWIMYKLELNTDNSLLPILFFVPLVIGLAGDSGTQANSVTVINLSANKKSEYNLILREFLVGLINGVICGVFS